MHKRINQILLKNWDPIGVYREKDTQDEYLTYALQIQQLMQRGCDVAQLEEYLISIESNLFGLVPNVTQIRRVAATLFSECRTDT